jgi:hypothetical protein
MKKVIYIVSLLAGIGLVVIAIDEGNASAAWGWSASCIWNLSAILYEFSD